jgi:hypothetical protein
MEGVRQVREGLSGIARGAGHIRSHLPTARAFAEEALAYGKARLPELAMAEGRNLIKQATGHEHPMDALSEVGGALYGAAFGSGEESAQGMARLREMGSRAMGTVQNRLRQLPMEEAGRFLQHQAQGNPEVLAGADIMRQGWNRLVGAGDQHILPYVGAAHALGMAGRMMYNQARARRNRQRSV